MPILGGAVRAERNDVIWQVSRSGCSMKWGNAAGARRYPSFWVHGLDRDSGSRKTRASWLAGQVEAVNIELNNAIINAFQT